MDILSQLALQSINGLVWGLILALIAVGLTLIFGLTEIVNLAHGELYMLGAVVGWYFIQYIAGFWLALLIVPILIGIVGLGLERLCLRPIEGNFVSTITATFGLSLIIQYLALAVFGGAPQRIVDPIGFNFTLLGSGYPLYRIVAAFISLLILVGLWLFIMRTKFGLWMRAVRQNRETSLTLGIPVPKVYLITFGLGSALAAFGGVLAAPIVAVEFRMGLDMLVLSFMAAIVGGLGNIKGTLIAAILIGELEGLLSIFILPTGARVISLILISAALFRYPEGLMESGLVKRLSFQRRRLS